MSSCSCCQIKIIFTWSHKRVDSSLSCISGGSWSRWAFRCARKTGISWYSRRSRCSRPSGGQRSSGTYRSTWREGRVWRRWSWSEKKTRVLLFNWSLPRNSLSKLSSGLTVRDLMDLWDQLVLLDSEASWVSQEREEREAPLDYLVLL